VSYFDQAQFDIRCEWGLPGIVQIAQSDVIIVVDVLSFSTSVDIAVSRGATIFPYRWKDETAATYAKERGAEVASSRSRFAGQFSLAPSSLVEVPYGLRLVLPSPNGSSLAFEAMSTGSIVAAGCLRNATAIAQWARSVGQRITVVPAGERWPDGSLRPAIEDLIGAGAILTQLSGRRSPEAHLAAVAFERVADRLLEYLLLSSSGRELVERGFRRDVELGAELNTSGFVPVLKGEAFIGLSTDKGLPSTPTPWMDNKSIGE
jgi:2-phosphosulfolactate phosphatase